YGLWFRFRPEAALASGKLTRGATGGQPTHRKSLCLGIPSKTEETKSMPLPQLNRAGELPEGVHHATLDEVIEQFGIDTAQRQALTARLQRIYYLAHATRKLDRLILFGSYITAKPAPNDVDIVLVMRDDFDVQACDAESQPLFDHLRAAEVFGASVF